VIYGALCVVGAWLFVREAKHGPPPEGGDPSAAPGIERDFALAY
jgi:hypothetical protein